MACARCSHGRTVDIEMKLRGNQLTLHACAACEVHWWDNEGTPMTLDDVLGLLRNAA